MEITKIGFIGGCINNQHGIKREEIYYSIISKNLDNDNVKHQILLGRYLHYSQLKSQVEKHIQQKQPDVIFLFIRPFPLMVLNKLFIKHVNKNKKKVYSFHPQLFLRNMKWDNLLTENQILNIHQSSKSKLFAIEDINILMGFFLGLHRWSLRYLIAELKLVKQICDNNNINLTIVLPPKYRKSFFSNYISKSTNRYLERNMNLASISIFDINDFESDKIHLNSNGHKVLGNRLYNKLRHI